MVSACWSFLWRGAPHESHRGRRPGARGHHLLPHDAADRPAGARDDHRAPGPLSPHPAERAQHRAADDRQAQPLPHAPAGSGGAAEPCRHARDGARSRQRAGDHRDNVGMGVGSVIYYQVIDPVKAKYEIQDVGYAIDQLTRTNLRNLMGGLTLDESLTSRDHVNVRLREVLDEASEKWGVKVTRVEIREIDPPKSIQDSMALQMQAERERRAQGSTAEGQKQAAILKAEGEKAAKLLSAEGDRDAQIARAEGDRQSEILRASGNAQAIATQFKAINEAGVSPQILALKYIEALQNIAGQGASKVFIPYEATALLGALGTLGEAVGGTALPKPDQSVLSAAGATRAKVDSRE